MILHWFIKARFTTTRLTTTRLVERLHPWEEAVATITYCGTEKVRSWRTVVRYQYSFDNRQYEGVKLFSSGQNVHTQMDARLLADKLVRQYPIGSKHPIKVHRKKAWLSKLS